MAIWVGLNANVNCERRRLTRPRSSTNSAPLAQSIRLIQPDDGRDETDGDQNQISPLYLRRPKDVRQANADRKEAEDRDQQHEHEPGSVVGRIEVSVAARSLATNPVAGTLVVRIGG